MKRKVIWIRFSFSGKFNLNLSVDRDQAKSIVVAQILMKMKREK